MDKTDSPGPAAPGLLLLVTPDAGLHRRVSALLPACPSAAGCELAWAHDPAEGREALRVRSPSAVLLDASAATALEGGEAPTVVLLGEEDAETERGMLARGVVDVLAREELGAPRALDRALRHALERARALGDLRRREDALLEVAANAPDVVVRLDGELRYLYANDAIEGMTGLPPLSFVGNRDADLRMPPQLLAPWEAALRRVMRTGAETEMEFEYPGPMGARRYRVRVVPEAAAGGSVRSVLAITRDAREGWRARASAMQSRDDYLRTLLEHATDVVAVIDAGGVVRFASPSVQRATGLPWHQVEGQNAFALVHRQDQARVRAAFARALRGEGGSQPLEFRLRHRDGSWRTHEALGEPLMHRPGVEAVLVASRDVTERKEAEAALRQSEEKLRAWQKIEAIGKLAGGIAHDLNNLLTVIKGNTALLRLDRDPADPSLEDVAEIERAADRASDMTRQLLAFSRKQVLRPRALDLNALVLRVDRMLRRLIGSDVELVTVLEPELGTVEADPGQLEQVLMNLALNARDAMPVGGTLTLETGNVDLPPPEERGWVTVPPMPAGPYVVLSVQDTGSGMDEATQRQIFEPFFTTKETGKGTGLGLSTAYGIVKQSGGFVWVDSAVGRGSTFRVYLPRASAEVAPEERAAPQDREGFAETILLVEDQDSVRRVAARTLARYGYAVLEATNGEEAVRLVEQYRGRIDLVLTDVVMPLMSGTQLAEWLAANRPGVRVLFMSGYSEEVVAQRGGAGWSAALIHKPFQPAALAARIREMLDEPVSA